MNQEFISKFLQVYSGCLFPNKDKTPEMIADAMSNSNITNPKDIADFPFANPKIAKILAFFGCEIFYVWDKYILKMYAYKVLVCLVPVLPALLFLKSTSLGLLLLIPTIIFSFIALLIMQKKIRKKIPEICKKYNCDILLKALQNPQTIEFRANYIKLMRSIFILLKDKNFRRSVKELRDSFFDM